MNEQVVKKENMICNLVAIDKQSAIHQVGMHLLSLGYVDQAYIDEMLQQQILIASYVGNYIAITHSLNPASQAVKNNGLVVLHYTNGIQFSGGKAYFLIGLATNNIDEHMIWLVKIAERFFDHKIVANLLKNPTPDQLYQLFI